MLCIEHLASHTPNVLTTIVVSAFDQSAIQITEEMIATGNQNDRSDTTFRAFDYNVTRNENLARQQQKRGGIMTSTCRQQAGNPKRQTETT